MKDRNDCTTQKIIEKVGCPYKVFTKENTAAEVREAYQNALTRGKKEGFFPVLVVSDETLEEWIGILEDESYSKEELLKQECKGATKILNERFVEYTEDYVDDISEVVQLEEDDMGLSELMGEKAYGVQLLELRSFMHYDGEGIQETILFEISVKQPWEIIAWLPIGGWNECPEPLEMMEVCRYWYEKYGAIPAVISHDELEFIVEKNVETDEQAWELAKEQYAFCPDCVEQGTGTIGALADGLHKSKVWYFWWD